MKLSFITLFFICSAFTPLHPLHVSIMQMDYRVENKSLEVTLKTFVDDLEHGLKDFSHKKVFLEKILGTDSSHILLEKYVREMTHFKVNSANEDFTWVGWEIDKDEVFIYFEIALPKKLKSLEVKNEMLMEKYLDQVNIVHLKYKDKNKSFLLEGHERVKSFTFNN